MYHNTGSEDNKKYCNQICIRLCKSAPVNVNNALIDVFSKENILSAVRYLNTYFSDANPEVVKCKKW